MLNVIMMVETVVQILAWLVMAYVMMKQTMLDVIMMVETVVQILTWLVMAYVTMKQTILDVIMMVETVVDLLFLVSPLAFFFEKFEIMNLMATLCRMQNMLMASLPGWQII